MTDSIRTTFDLAKLSKEARMDVGATICSETTAWGELKRIYDKASTQTSPMADTKTYWHVRTEKDSEGNFVPVRIESRLNIPNAVTGQNVIHGTSVFAAGVSAFHLQRIWMASSGVSHQELDKLILEDISLDGVTLSYPQYCQAEAEARALVRDIYETAKGLYNDGCVVFSSGNDTVYIRRGEYEITIYNKTDLSHCAFKQGMPVQSVLELSPLIVRIEVKLGTRFLRKRGLLSLESWRHAYADGLYERLFKDTVRKTLRLEGERLRHKAPRQEVLSKLTPTEAHLLNGYLAGRDPRRARAVIESARPSNRFYELRKALLDKAQVDIDIPWATHKRLRCFELADSLMYRGDCDPAQEYVDWTFCRSNWSMLRESMYSLYEEAVTRAAA
jgi:hypothetical protein